MTRKTKQKTDLFEKRLDDIKCMSHIVYHFENCLDAGLEPLITPELGDELKKLIDQNTIPLSSLTVFLQHAPFSINYWNNIKAIYKLLELRLIGLSELQRHSYKHKFEISLIIRNLAVLFSRLETPMDCTKCPGYFAQTKKKPTFCNNPCERWSGGIKYTRQILVNDEYTFDKLGITDQFVKVDGIHAAEIFIETRDFRDKISLLLLVDESIDRGELTKFIKLAQKFNQENTAQDFPKIQNTRIFTSNEFKHPWTSRGASNNGPRAHFFSHVTNEVYADIRPFTDNARPTERTIQYMRRRSRRLLRSLQQNNTKIYVDLCIAFFSHLDYPQKNKMSSQWLLHEIIFGADKSVQQGQHGRGKIEYPKDYGQRTQRSEPCKTQWDKTIEKIKPLIIKGSSYLIITEFCLKIWRDQSNERRKVWLGLSINCLNNYLQSSSKIIAQFALEQLELKPKKINRVEPASIARGLATVETEVAEYYFDLFFHSHRELINSMWMTRFSFDLDDAIYSLKSHVKTDDEKERCLVLGLLSLQLPWSGYINIKVGDPQKTDQLRLPKEIIKKVKNPLSWNSKLRASTWRNGVWKRPNVSLCDSGLIGWPHAIFDRDIVTMESKPRIGLEKYLLDANPYRLINLLNLKTHLLHCHGAPVDITEIKEEFLTRKSVLVKKASLSETDDPVLTIADNETGHYTQTDLRILPCEVCGSSHRNNHAPFIPFSERESKEITDYKKTWKRGPHVQPKQSKKAFWEKVGEHEQKFKVLDPAKWLQTEVIISLNKIMNNEDLEPEIIGKIYKNTAKAINNGNDEIVLQLLKEDIPSMPIKTIISRAIAVDENLWINEYKNGKIFKKMLSSSSDSISYLWKSLGYKSIEKRTLINQRFFQNPELTSLIIKNFIPEFIENLSDEQASFLSNFIDLRPELFNLDDGLLMRACLTSHSIINEKALEVAKDIGLTTSFAIGLIESDFPKGEDVAKEYFLALDPASEGYIDDILSLCDSPHERTRYFGLELIQNNKNNIPMAQLFLRLKENRHKNIRKFLANELVEGFASLDSLDFDIHILRSRNSERVNKELIKKRLEKTIPNVHQSKYRDLIKALRELSLGLVPGDKEWAIEQLTKLKLRGQEIPEMEIEKIEETTNEISTII